MLPRFVLTTDRPSQVTCAGRIHIQEASMGSFFAAGARADELLLVEQHSIGGWLLSPLAQLQWTALLAGANQRHAHDRCSRKRGLYPTLRAPLASAGA